MLRVPNSQISRRMILSGVRASWKKARGGQTETWHQFIVINN